MPISSLMMAVSGMSFTVIPATKTRCATALSSALKRWAMQDKIFDVVVPTEEEIEIKDGKRRTVERRVFPGYILVQMMMTEESWYVVRNTPGVTGFVGMGNEPTPLRPDEVAKIMNRMEMEAPKVKFDFQIGEKVRIGTGPFADFIGTIQSISTPIAPKCACWFRSLGGKRRSSWTSCTSKRYNGTGRCFSARRLITGGGC